MRLVALTLTASLLATAGCWSEVAYEPDEPATEAPLFETPPPVGESATEPVSSPPVPTEELIAATPAEPVPAEPSTEQTATASAESSGELAEGKLTFEELFGSDETEEAESPPTEAPPLAEETAAPPAEATAPVAEGQQPELMPWEQEPTMTPEEAPVSDNLSGSDRYTPVPATPPVMDEPSATVEALLPELPAEEPNPDAAAPLATTPREKDETDAPRAGTEPATDIVPRLPAEEPFEPATPAQLDPTNTRHLAWLLGSKWSLTVLSQHAGASPDEQAPMHKESELLAQALGVALPRTSPYSASQPTAAFLTSVLPAGRELGAAVGSEHGADEIALVEAAMKSNLLLVLSQSRPDLIPAVTRSVTTAAERAKLPRNLVQPFTTALADSPTPEQIDRAVFDFHRAVEKHLREAK